MPDHRIYLSTDVAEELLDLPPGAALVGASVADGILILAVSSTKSLGGADLDSSYEPFGDGEALILKSLTSRQ